MIRQPVDGPRHAGQTYNGEQLLPLDTTEFEAFNGSMIQPAELAAAAHTTHTHVHDHEDHEHANHDEHSVNPGVWRRIVISLGAASMAEIGMEAAAEAKPRAIVGLDVAHTAFADMTDYVSRWGPKMIPLAALALGTTMIGDRVKGIFGAIRNKLTAGAMIVGNAAAMAYTGYAIADHPSEHSPLEFASYDWKSYLAPSVGMVAVMAANRYGHTKLADSPTHTDQDGLEHLGLDSADAQGRLLGAMINPFTAAAATFWYGGKGIKFAVERLWKAQHGHNHPEESTRIWRRARLALGATVLACSLGGQILTDADETHQPSHTQASQSESGEERADRPSTIVELPPTSVQIEPIVVELPVYDATISPHEGTYWSLAYQQAALLLGRTPTDTEVHSLTSRLLSQNNETWETAAGAQPGDEVEMLDSQTATSVLAQAA